MLAAPTPRRARRAGWGRCDRAMTAVSGPYPRATCEPAERSRARVAGDGDRDLPEPGQAFRYPVARGGGPAVTSTAASPATRRPRWSPRPRWRRASGSPTCTSRWRPTASGSRRSRCSARRGRPTARWCDRLGRRARRGTTSTSCAPRSRRSGRSRWPPRPTATTVAPSPAWPAGSGTGRAIFVPAGTVAARIDGDRSRGRVGHRGRRHLRRRRRASSAALAVRRRARRLRHLMGGLHRVPAG